MSISKTIFVISTCFLFFFSINCRHTKKQIHRGFYYWKTDFRLAGNEEQRLEELKIQKLYVRFFDVNLNAANEAVPIAKIVFNSTPPSTVEIAPVIFITNNTLKQSAPEKIEALARNIINLVDTTAVLNKISYREIQFDCDWTPETREKFFSILEYAKSNTASKKLLISCTIRLHQVKYYRKTGLPPVNRGMLMFYNMGEIADTAFNSIFNEEDVVKYMASIKKYPLSLDIALPVFCWVKHYRNGRLIGLLNNLKESDLGDTGFFVRQSAFHYRSVKGGFFRGEYIQQNDLLIAEELTPSLAKKSAELLAKNFSAYNFTIVLYHWDHSNLFRYENKNFEALYHCFD